MKIITSFALVLPLLLTTSRTASAAQIYFSADSAIWTADLDGSNAQTLSANPNGGSTQLALDLAGGKIYLAQGGGDVITRSNLDSTGYEVLVTGQPAPFGVALDLVNDKLYWADRDLVKIQRSNLDGTGVENVVTGLSRPRQLALDVANQKVYWTEGASFAHFVRRANFDGTGQEDLFVGDAASRPHGIALDLVADKVYWTDNQTGIIRRASLDGSAQEIVLSGLGGMKGISLDVVAGQMYFVGSGKVRRADLDGSNLIDLVNIFPADVKGIALDLTPIPEPSTLTLAGLGLVALLAYGRRRRPVQR